MDLRVTPQILVSRSIANARRHFDRLANLQEQAATGVRLLRPSDGPLQTVQVLSNKAQSLRLDTYLANVRDARTTLDLGVSALREASNIFTSAREIAIEASHATNNAESFEALAQQVDALITRLLGIANTQHAGRYLFAGTASQTSPFAIAAADGQGRPLSVTYAGSEQSAEELVGPSQTLATLYAGGQIFQQRERATTVFMGDTGAAPGTGTDSATGQGTLIVRHTATTYAVGSGVQPGTSSSTGDTIIGPAGAHRLTIIDTSGTGASGTVSLNGGPPVAFTSADTNLLVGGPAGEVVYVDTTSITPGFNGDVAITADGTLSVDGGATEVAIDFSGNQVVTNSQTGSVTNVDSTSIRRVGSEHLDYTGSYDAFEILIALRDDLRNTRGLTDRELAESISRRLGELDRVRTAVLDVVGEQSASLQTLDALERRIEDVQLETRKLTAELEAADLSEIVLSLQSQENLLQLTFAAASRVLDQSLLDFLR
jgi:flagellar hook-associated protein 3